MLVVAYWHNKRTLMSMAISMKMAKDISDITLVASQYIKKPGDSDYNITIVSKANLAPPYDASSTYLI